MSENNTCTTYVYSQYMYVWVTLLTVTVQRCFITQGNRLMIQLKCIPSISTSRQFQLQHLVFLIESFYHDNYQGMELFLNRPDLFEIRKNIVQWIGEVCLKNSFTQSKFSL